MTVRLAIKCDNAFCTKVSLSTSNEALASSNKIIGASLRIARAIEIRCRCPPDNFEPFSPITVLYPSGSFSTNSSQKAFELLP